MYLNHFNLKERPFATTPDPAFLIWTKAHKKAFDGLCEGVGTHGKLTLLVGEVGCGKTTLIQGLLHKTAHDTGIAPILISTRIGSVHELLRHLLTQLSVQGVHDTQEEGLRQLSTELARLENQSRVPLIIVDEAQTIDPEAALILAKIASEGLVPAKPASVVLAGQPELDRLVKSSELAPLRKAISQRITLAPLSDHEVRSFVTGRLAAAGLDGDRIFDDSSIKVIQTYARGTPRLINKLCDLALFAAARQELQTIDGPLVAQVIAQFAPAGGASIKHLDLTKPKQIHSDNQTPFDLESAGLSGRDRSEPEQLPAQKAAPAKTLPATQEQQHTQITLKTVPPPESAKSGFLPGFLAGALAAGVGAVGVFSVLPRNQDVVTENTLAPATTVPDAAIQVPTELRTGSQIDAASVATVSQENTEDIAEAQLRLEALNSAISEAQQRRDAVEADLETRKASVEALNEEIDAKRALSLELSQNLEDAEVAVAGRQSPTNTVDAAAMKSEGAQETATEIRPAKEKKPVSLLLPSEPDVDPSQLLQDAIGSDDSQIAAIKFAQAAIRGHPRGARYLGQLYETGDGVMFDPDIAQRWYLVAEGTHALHAPALTSGPVAATDQHVIAMASITQGETADFIWQGRAETFILQIAGADQGLLGEISTPLTAMRVVLPEAAALWRITTDAGSTFEWRQISAAEE